MIRKKLEPGTAVFHTVQGIGIFRSWWLDQPEYARVQYLVNNKSVILLIPRKDLTEIEKDPKDPEENKSKYESIEIQFDDDHTPEDTVSEVLRLIKEGFTSGYSPTWKMNKKET